MTRLGARSVFFLLGAASTLLAADPPQTGFWAGVVGGFPLSDFKDRTSTSGPGISAGWSFWQIAPGSALGLYLEHRSFASNPARATLTDLGFDLRGSIHGGFYDRFGLSAERVDVPGTKATTKLGGRFGVGYRFDSPLGIEIYTSHLAASRPPATTINVAVLWAF